MQASYRYQKGRLFGMALATLLGLGVTAWAAGPVLTETQVIPSSGASNDYFGRAAAFSTRFLAVSAPTVTAGGKVILFDQNIGWAESHTIESGESNAGDQFGRSVAISDTHLLVGAIGHDLPDGNATISNAGAAYLFERQDENFVLVQKLTAPDPDTFDFFGQSVALTDEYAFVSAYLKRADDNASLVVGAVHVFDLTDPSYPLLTTIQPNSLAHSAEFGYSIAVEGTRLAVGSPGRLSSRGAAYVFEFGDGNFNLAQTIVPTGLAASDRYGHAVALGGTMLLVGAPGRDTAATDAGAGYVYLHNGSSYTLLTTRLPDGANASDSFGATAAVEGAYYAIGAPGYNSAYGGAVFLYQQFNNTFAEDFPPVFTAIGPTGNMGVSLAMHGELLFAGANDANVFGPWSGSGYLFEGFPETEVPALSGLGALALMGAASVGLRRRRRNNK